MPELVLYGKRELALQFLGTILDIEVDYSALLNIRVDSLMFRQLQAETVAGVVPYRGRTTQDGSICRNWGSGFHYFL